MEFVGNKNEKYEGVLPATSLYPELAISEFQNVFHFLNNETQECILHNATVARAIVNQELRKKVSEAGSLDALSIAQFDEKQTGTVLYIEAVFSLTAHYLVENQLSMNATKDAADRQEALQSKVNNCLVQYRRAVDLLLNGVETYRIEVV